MEQHPTVKMLALSFLVLVGVALIAEGTGHEMPKGYLYFAMAFSFMVEMLNLNLRKKQSLLFYIPLYNVLRKQKIIDLHFLYAKNDDSKYRYSLT